MIILVHEECGGEVLRVGEDGIKWCTLCEVVVEGEPCKSIDTDEKEE